MDVINKLSSNHKWKKAKLQTQKPAEKKPAEKKLWKNTIIKLYYTVKVNKQSYSCISAKVLIIYIADVKKGGKGEIQDAWIASEETWLLNFKHELGASRFAVMSWRIFLLLKGLNSKKSQ